MDFNSLFAQFAPQLTGMADASPMAGAAPSLLGSTPPPTAPPMPTRAPFAAPQQQPQPRGGGAMDIVAEIAPLILSAFTAMKGDPGAAGALMQGVARGRELSRQRQMETENRDLERRQVAAKYMQQVAADAGQFTDIEEHQKYLEYAERVGQAYGIQPGELTRTVAFPKTKVAAAKQKAAQQRLQALESSANYKDIIGTPQEEGLSVTMDDGERLTVAQLRARAGLALTDAAGKQVVPTPTVKPEKPEELPTAGSFADYLRRYGKPDMTQAEFNALKTQYEGLNDRPVDPQLKTLRDIAIANAQTAQSQRSASLPDRAQRRVDTLARGFDSQKPVQRAVTMAEAVNFANGMDPNTKNPADDQALIYAFAKAMDPDSVVREGEYNTVQKYSQSWLEQFGFNAKRIITNTAFLTPQARAMLKATIQQKFAANRTQYDNLRRSYAERINRITGQQDGADYLTDYAGGFPDAPSSAPATARKIGRFEVEVRGGK